MIRRTAARRLRRPWYLCLVGCRSGPRVDAAAIIEVLACKHFHHREATARTVPRRSSESHLSARFSLLWGIAPLGLQLLASDDQIGGENAHAYRLLVFPPRWTPAVL